MRVTVTFNTSGPESSINFPLHYNYCLQGFIYHHISTHLADFLHNKGYRYRERAFRMFTFSRVFGRYRIRKEKQIICFNSPIKFQISSPLKDFLQEFAETLARIPEVSIEGNTLLVSSIEVHFPPSATSPQLIKMLSPVTVYSTLSTPSGKKKTYYYSPFEEEFSRLIRENMVKKYTSLYGSSPTSDELTIAPARVSKNSEKIIKYTPDKAPAFIIKGWMGQYRLEGNPELIRLAHDTGIGAKNSQGFGMFETKNPEKPEK